uniref:Transglutaminase-like domain-containing protein n=1 Tax=Schlesneria paludicola TaxID=360056 RepID=A0A7C4QQ38_9PLAN
MSPEERSSRGLQTLVLAAAWFSLAAHLGAVFADQPPWIPWVCWLTGGFILAGVSLWLNRKWDHLHDVPWLSPVGLALFLAPLAFEGGVRVFHAPRNPWEHVLMTAVLCVALGLAAASGLRSCQPLAMTAGLFVSIFAASLSGTAMTCIGSAGFAVMGVLWLAVTHWSSIARRLPRRSQRRYPLRAVALGGAILLCPLLALGVAQGDRFWSLAGWMPTSGGEGREDPTARRGVGDGAALVAGLDNIQSFGPIEDAPFRSSDDPSLYDLFDELYDEPVRKQRNIDRAISLPPETLRLAETQMAKSQQAHKEFSTARRSRSTASRLPRDLTSTALFYVKGRTPLHLRHEVFDLFDGVDWYPADPDPEERQPKLTMVRTGERSWLQVDRGYAPCEYLAPAEAHAVKIVHLQTNRLPLPLHWWGVHIDLLHEVDFFRWHGADLLEMKRERLPELTAIHYRSQTVDWRKLPRRSYWGRWQDPRCRELPLLPAMERVQQLAEAWAGELPHGWPQIQAIIERLRTDFIHDRDAKPPVDADCPVEHFLFESRRGPDYLFATAAAVLLRSLGYSTRLVGGFYAAPERYDTQRGHTPVTAADTHIWLEVYHVGRVWLTLEPTPGYEILGPPPTWGERLWHSLVSAARWLMSHALFLAFALALTFAAWRWRSAWLDALSLLWWQWCPARTIRRRILQTLRLVDFRLRLRHQPRPLTSAPADWYSRIDLPTDTARADLLHLARLADWAAFAPAQAVEPQQIHEVCCRAVHALPPLRPFASRK